MKKILLRLLGRSLSQKPSSFHNDTDSVFEGIEIWCTNGRLLSLGFEVKASKGTNPKISLPFCPGVVFTAEGLSNNLSNGLLGRLVPREGTNKIGDVKTHSSLFFQLKRFGFNEVKP